MTEIIDGGHFFFQEKSPAVGAALQGIEKMLRSAGLAAKPAATKVDPGNIVAAQFSADKEWYRARVIKNHGIGHCVVHFIDYGNKETTPFARIRAVDAVTQSVKECAGLCHEGFVAFTKGGSADSAEGSEAAFTLKEYCAGPVLLRQEYTEGKSKFYTIKQGSGDISVNEEVLMRGFTYVRRDLEADENLKGQLPDVLKAQKLAEKGRKGMWRYGDPRDEEEQ